MALSVFPDKGFLPSPDELRNALEDSHSWWVRLIELLTQDHGPMQEEWNFAGAKYGWSFRLRARKRVVVYLIPQSGHFLVGMVLGERAVACLRAMQLPPELVALVEAAPVYAEGRGLRFPVQSVERLPWVLVLARAKMGLG